MPGKIETMEDLQQVFERTLQLALSFFTIVLLAGATYFAARDRVAAAGLMMGIFVISVLTLSLPRLRVIEGFGVKASLDEAVRKAELTLEQFKRLARATARQGFQQVFRGELRDAPFAEKQAFIAALNDGMDAAGLEKQEADDLRAPLYRALAIDLASVVQTAANHLRVRRIREVEAAAGGESMLIMPAVADEEPEQVRRRAERQRLMQIRVPGFGPPSIDNLAAVLDSCAGPFHRTEDENRRLLSVIASAKRIMAACQNAGNVTSDSDDFLRFKVQFHPGVYHRDDSAERAEGILHSRFAEL